MKRNLLCAAMWLFATAAAAQDLSERERQIFRALDLDGDTSISRDEARWGREVIQSLAQDSAGAGATAGSRATAAPSDLFRRLDRNRDGRLSESELWGAQVPRGGWMAIDRNGDGLIAPAEFSAIR